jgi:hypothetical protein
MRLRITRGWRRIAVGLCVLLAVGPFAVGEGYHVWRWGHLGIGLHADLVSWDIGSPTHAEYSLWGSNLTPVPLPVRVCLDRSEGIQVLFRYRNERWNSETSRWDTVSATASTCEGRARLAWLVWWPGTSRRLIPAEDGFRRHRHRFTAFTLWDRPDDGPFQFGLGAEPAIPLESAGLR